MVRSILAGLAVLGMASVASAGVVNGTFDAGYAGWTTSGFAEIRNAGDFGMPDSPSGAPFAGAVTNWGSPSGGASQTVNWTGPGTLSGELFAAAHSLQGCALAADVEVLWNNTVVASVSSPSSSLWAADYPWVPFSVPVNGSGADTLTVRWTTRSAEWSWVGADNLAITPEPVTLALLAMALPVVRRRR